MHYAIAVLGGGMINDGSRWRTTRYLEIGDKNGVSGDWLRVVAAADLYPKNKDAVFIVSGGRGQYATVPGAPTIAHLLAEELRKLGVPRAKIIQERESNNTYEQLLFIPRVLKKFSIHRVGMITNHWHIPRVRAFMRYNKDIHALYRSIRVDCIDAERVVVKHHPEMKAEIAAVLKSELVRARAQKERQGIAAIKSGTYQVKNYA